MRLTEVLPKHPILLSGDELNLCYWWVSCVCGQSVKGYRETEVLHKSYFKSYKSFPSKLITQVVPTMVLSLPMTQCHSGGPVILSLSCEMPSSHCCPRCTTACEPHLNPSLFSLSYSLCSGCLCLYHPSSILLGALETIWKHLEGFIWWKQNEE